MLEALDLETLPARLRCSMTQMATEQAARHAVSERKYVMVLIHNEDAGLPYLQL